MEAFIVKKCLGTPYPLMQAHETQSLKEDFWLANQVLLILMKKHDTRFRPCMGQANLNYFNLA